MNVHRFLCFHLFHKRLLGHRFCALTDKMHLLFVMSTWMNFSLKDVFSYSKKNNKNVVVQYWWVDSLSLSIFVWLACVFLIDVILVFDTGVESTDLENQFVSKAVD